MSDTDADEGFFSPSKGKPIAITTNRKILIVLGPKREFEVQVLEPGSHTITPNQGKVGIVRHTEKRENGKYVYTVDLYRVKNPNVGDKLEATGVVREVEEMLDVSYFHIKSILQTNVPGWEQDH